MATGRAQVDGAGDAKAGGAGVAVALLGGASHERGGGAAAALVAGHVGDERLEEAALALLHARGGARLPAGGDVALGLGTGALNANGAVLGGVVAQPAELAGIKPAGGGVVAEGALPDLAVVVAVAGVRNAGRHMGPRVEAKGGGVLDALGALHVHQAGGVGAAAVGVDGAVVTGQRQAVGGAPVAVTSRRVALVRGVSTRGRGGDGALAALGAGLAVPAGVEEAHTAEGGRAVGVPAVAGRSQAGVGGDGPLHVGHGLAARAAGRAGDAGRADVGELALAVRVSWADLGGDGAGGLASGSLVTRLDHCACRAGLGP